MIKPFLVMLAFLLPSVVQGQTFADVPWGSSALAVRKLLTAKDRVNQSLGGQPLSLIEKDLRYVEYPEER